MPKRIAITKTDGSVAIMQVMPGADKEECIEMWKEANPGKYVSHDEVNTNELPADRSQRDKWFFSKESKKIKIK